LDQLLDQLPQICSLVLQDQINRISDWIKPTGSAIGSSQQDQRLDQPTGSAIGSSQQDQRLDQPTGSAIGSSQQDQRLDQPTGSAIGSNQQDQINKSTGTNQQDQINEGDEEPKSTEDQINQIIHTELNHICFILLSGDQSKLHTYTLHLGYL
jgi:hypothetical protein